MTVVLQVFLISLIAGPAQALRLWDAAATARLEARLQAMREAGEPTTMADLHRLYPDPPAGENAAPLFRAAFRKMEAIEGENPGRDLPILGDADLPPVDADVPPQMLRAIEAYLDRHGEALELLHQAAAKKGCKFDLQFEDGAAMLLPHLAQMRQGARLLALEALVRTERGKPDDAAESLIAGLRIGHAVRQEPVLITALVRVACDIYAVRQAQRWVCRTTPSPKALARVQAALAAEGDPDLLRPVLLAERCFGMDIYRDCVLNPKKGNLAELVGQGGPPAMLIPAVPRAYFKMDMVHYIDLMTEYTEALRRPYPERLQVAARVGARMDERIPKHYVVCRMILPALSRAFTVGQEHMARMDSARLALAALRYRAQHARLPKTLDALVPDFVEAVPPDPFTAKPLRYRKDKTGFVVYALGENGRDDAGDVEADEGKPPDIGFRFRQPKADF
ncbi:MAG: hypothetical protein ACODAJ_06165 [Planctomycetota bacterium]